MFAALLKMFRENFLFFAILAVFVSIRLYRLSELTTFGGDQGVDFLTVRDMVLYQKWTLIGIKTSIAPFFQGPLYLYILYPFFYLMNLNPLAGAVSALCVSFLSIVLFYVTINKFFSKTIALWASFLYSVSPELVIYGNTPLYQNLLPVFITAAIYIFLTTTKSLAKYFLLGFVLGLGTEMHFLNVTLVISVFIFITFWEKVGLKKTAGFVLGLLAGVLPTIIFELRHNFLNINLLLNYVSEEKYTKVALSSFFNQWLDGSARFLTGNIVWLGGVVLLFCLIYLIPKKKKDNAIQKFQTLMLVLFMVINLCGFTFSVFGAGYPLPFFMMMIVLVPIFVFDKFSKKTANFILLLIVLVNINATVGRLNRNSGYDMPAGLTLNKIDSAGRIISEDAGSHPNFNVASILDGGTRAYPLRYTVLIHGGSPDIVENFPNNNFLYVLASDNVNDLFESHVWEIDSLKPFEVGREWDLGKNIFLYRLDKQF